MKKNKINKKGFLIVMEATIALLILFGFLFVSLGKENQITQQSYNTETQNTMVLQYLQDFIEQHEEIRELVITNPPELTGEVRNYLQGYNTNLNASVVVCELDNECPLDIPPGKEIRTRDFLIISGNSGTLSIKKTVIAIWNNY